jgi:predicted O-methyltransferase YrrM
MDEAVKAVLAEYDARSAREAQQWREIGTTMSRDDFLLAVGPATGSLMSTLIKGAGAKHILEIGTSYGYSMVWLADAARHTGGKVTSLDVAANKQAYAKDMLAKAGLADFAAFRTGDALELIPQLADGIDFVLLDCWKDVYVPCLDRFFPKLAPGAVVVADNMLFPTESRPDALAYRRAVRAKPGVSSVLLSVGSGLEVSRLAGPLDEGVEPPSKG